MTEDVPDLAHGMPAPCASAAKVRFDGIDQINCALVIRSSLIDVMQAEEAHLSRGWWLRRLRLLPLPAPLLNWDHIG
jgi:hypothetical protein